MGCDSQTKSVTQVGYKIHNILGIGCISVSQKMKTDNSELLFLYPRLRCGQKSRSLIAFNIVCPLPNTVALKSILL
jgi:hypothetical protein